MVVFLSWGRPSSHQRKACVDTSGGVFNYDADYRGASSSHRGGPAAEAALSGGGFHVNRARVLLGSGPDTFRRAKAALRAWRHFRLGWAFVDPETAPVEKGTKFCVCVREILPWVMMPLQIVYVNDIMTSGDGHAGAGRRAAAESRPSNHLKACFGFGSGTLRGHLLAGEEWFSVEWDQNDQVYYEIFSFSKPAHLLSTIGYPYVKLRQKYFAQESARAFIADVTGQQSPT